MARTALSLIPSPDPDTFTELLVNELHVPLDSTTSMRRWLPEHLWKLAHEWLDAMDEREGLVPPTRPPPPKLPRPSGQPASVASRRSPSPLVKTLRADAADFAATADGVVADEAPETIQLGDDDPTQDEQSPSTLPQTLTRAERLDRRRRLKEKRDEERRRRPNESRSHEAPSSSTSKLAPSPMNTADLLPSREMPKSLGGTFPLASPSCVSPAPLSPYRRLPLDDRNGRTELQNGRPRTLSGFAPPKEVRPVSTLPNIRVIPPTSPAPPFEPLPSSLKLAFSQTQQGLIGSPSRRPSKRIKADESNESSKRAVHIEPDDDFVLPFQFPS